jgi:HECT-domain (ubiquitin-transferase)
LSSGEEVPLCRDGESRSVDESNKFEYVELMARWKTTYSVSQSLDPFLKGFHELVPLKLIKEAEINPAELSLILSGKPDFDVEELRPYVMFQGGPNFNERNELILWLWQALREFDEEGRRGFLKFFTGSTRIPLDGFEPPLNITEGVDMVDDSLPKAHTCFNQLVIPKYTSFEKMKERILFAITNTEGFELS